MALIGGGLPDRLPEFRSDRLLAQPKLLPTEVTGSGTVPTEVYESTTPLKTDLADGALHACDPKPVQFEAPLKDAPPKCVSHTKPLLMADDLLDFEQGNLDRLLSSSGNGRFKYDLPASEDNFGIAYFSNGLLALAGDTGGNASSLVGHEAVNGRNAVVDGQPVANSGSKIGRQPTYESIMDTFTSNFEELSKLDQSKTNTDLSAGSVRVNTPSGSKSLQKTADGFVMTINNKSEASPMHESMMGSWFEDVQTTFSLNEKTNILTVREETTHGSHRWSQHNSTESDFHCLDLSTRKFVVGGELRPLPRPGQAGPALPSPGPMAGDHGSPARS